MTAIPLTIRLANAVVSYAIYLGQLIYPARLCVIYILREAPPTWEIVVAAITLVAITAGVIYLRRTRPYLAVGWFWYLGTLVPVIGLVQVGTQTHADRYMYVPMVGLLIMIGWGLKDWIAQRPRAKTGIAMAVAIAGIAFIAAAYVQTGYWQNSGLLFARALEFTQENYIAEMQYGNYLMDTHRGLEAIPHFEAALRYAPKYADLESNIGMILGTIPGRLPEAISHFEAALRMQPNLPEAHYNLGVALSEIPGREAEAIAQFEISERLKPRPNVPALMEKLRARQK